MTDRVVLCMVIEGKATLYEGGEPFSTLRVPHHFDETRAYAWAMGTLSVLAADEVHEIAEARQPALPRAQSRASVGSLPSAMQLLDLLKESPTGLSRAEAMERLSLDAKQLNARLHNLRQHRLVTVDTRGRLRARTPTPSNGDGAKAAPEPHSGIKVNGAGRPLSIGTLNAWKVLKDAPEGMTRSELAAAAGITELKLYGALKRNKTLFRIEGGRVYAGTWEGPPPVPPPSQE